MSRPKLTTLERLEAAYGLKHVPDWGTDDKLDRLVRVVAAMDEYIDRLHEPAANQEPRDGSNPGYGPQDR